MMPTYLPELYIILQQLYIYIYIYIYITLKILCIYDSAANTRENYLQ